MRLSFTQRIKRKSLMNFNTHYDLVGRHAFLSASKYHWINYDDEKIDATFRTHLAAQRGTEMHELGYNLIRMGVKLPKTQKTINMYVNDAIGFRMTPEQILFYSENSFGTADCISFHKGVLRIHDLKTGVTRTSEHQLEVYVALFCLEYNVNPNDIEIELRIYQNDDVQIYEPDPVDILNIMGKIITFDKRIQAIKAEAL
jgi:hypothetical protein